MKEKTIAKGMKAMLAMFATMLLLVGLCACASNETQNDNANVNDNLEEDLSSAESELASPAPLEVSDFGWFTAEGNMVELSVAVSNPNTYIVADDIVATVVGTDKDNKEVFTEDIAIPFVTPGSDYVLSYVVGNGEPVVNVSVLVSVAEDGWEIYEGIGSHQYEISDVAIVDSDIEGVQKFQGNVIATVDDDTPMPGQSMINVVLYDENGKMLGGYFDIVELGDGEEVPFEIYAIDAPAYKDYKVFVSTYEFNAADEAEISK